jgi:hypothetical protein
MTYRVQNICYLAICYLNKISLLNNVLSFEQEKGELNYIHTTNHQCCWYLKPVLVLMLFPIFAFIVTDSLTFNWLSTSVIIVLFIALHCCHSILQSLFWLKQSCPFEEWLTHLLMLKFFYCSLLRPKRLTMRAKVILRTYLYKWMEAG